MKYLLKRDSPGRHTRLCGIILSAFRAPFKIGRVIAGIYPFVFYDFLSAIADFVKEVTRDASTRRRESCELFSDAHIEAKTGHDHETGRAAGLW